MDSQRTYPQLIHNDQDPSNVGLHAGEGDENQDKHSVLKKVKQKAKKIKDTLKTHGHRQGHDHDHDRNHEGHVPDDHDMDQEDDEDEEPLEDNQLTSESEAVTGGLAPGQVEKFVSPSVYGSSAVMQEHPSPSAPVTSPPSISSASGGPTGLDEDPQAPKDKRQSYGPSHDQTKVTDPNGAGGAEVEVTPLLDSLDKMNIHEKNSEAKEASPGRHDQSSILPTGSHNQFSPEPTRAMSIASQHDSQSVTDAFDDSKLQDHSHVDDADNKPSNQSSYTGKISSATSAIANKAVSAKNVVASKLGYAEKENSTPDEVREGQDATKPTSPVAYGKQIATTVAQKLTPVYEKVAGVGTTVISKAHGANPSPSTETQIRVEGQDKGVSVKDYFAEKLRPGEEDKALSEVISEALHKQKARTDNSVGEVTQAEEVEKRPGSGDEERTNPSSGKAVVDKLKGAVGSWFVKGEESRASEQPSGSIIDANESTISGVGLGEQTGERRVQESGN